MRNTFGHHFTSHNLITWREAGAGEHQFYGGLVSQLISLKELGTFNFMEHIFPFSTVSGVRHYLLISSNGWANKTSLNFPFWSAVEAPILVHGRDVVVELYLSLIGISHALSNSFFPCSSSIARPVKMSANLNVNFKMTIRMQWHLTLSIGKWIRVERRGECIFTLTLHYTSYDGRVWI